MNQIPLATSSTIIPAENFWHSVLLYHDRPHLINRKLGAVAQILFCQISFVSLNIKRISDIFSREALLYETRKLPQLKSVTPDFIKNIAETYDKEVLITKTSVEHFNDSFDDIFISVRILYGRKDKIQCLETVILDKKNKIATFFAPQEYDKLSLAPHFPYHIELTKEGNLRINLNNFEDADTSSAEWLASKLFPKLIKWTEIQPELENTLSSLSLVEGSEYYNLYTDLKAKYGKNLVEAWPQRAKTDPLKFVYEDLAIAAYLICLWRQLGCKNVNFVDCGCGNGLLVYVLCQEGYRGCGFDVRSRNIWELFPVDLRVEPVTPSSTFPEATWIIGNHSDELTPWIPVIASRSSPKTNYFVIPCCMYDFSGQKYIRMDINKSQYNDYLNYIENISNICAFNTLIDKLRIPSTKRVCLIGIRENCKQTELEKINRVINEFVESRLDRNFVARKPVEEVRNCTKLNKSLISKIVKLTADALLAKQDFIDTKANGKSWNRGGIIPLSELSQIIPKEDLKSLKRECGGLQTLLKNHRYIFEVRERKIYLQKPLSLSETSKYKDKPCWCFLNHPDGCLFDAETCAYKH